MPERSPAFLVWGILAFGSIGLTSVLSTSGIQISEFISPSIFALSGIILSLSILNKPRYLAPNPGSKGQSFGLIFFLLAILATIGLFSDSWSFPLLMTLGYSPLLIFSKKQLHFSHLKIAVLAGTSFVSFSLISLAILIPSQLFGSCRFDKCSVWGGSIGNLSSGNGFGIVLSAIGILGVLFVTSFPSKVIVALSSGLLIEAGVGRTSLIAHIGTISLLIIINILGKSRLRKNLILVTTLAASFAFALFPFEPQDLTFRGELWIYAKENIGDALLFGHGSSEWVRSANSSGIVLNYSTHNIWLESLYVSGVFGLLVLLATLVSSPKLWGPRVNQPLVGMFLWIILSGLTEVPAYFARTYLVPGFLLIYCLTTLAMDHSELEKERTT